VDDDGTDIERPALEGSPFKDFHDRPNGVIAAEIVVEPKLIEPMAAVTVEELDASRACAGHLGWPAVDERAEIVDEDDRRLAVGHRTMMPGLPRRLDPMSGSAAIRSLPGAAAAGRSARCGAALWHHTPPLRLCPVVGSAHAADGDRNVQRCTYPHAPLVDRFVRRAACARAEKARDEHGRDCNVRESQHHLAPAGRLHAGERQERHRQDH
jgi:hypothetical protein